MCMFTNVYKCHVRASEAKNDEMTQQIFQGCQEHQPLMKIQNRSDLKRIIGFLNSYKEKLLLFFDTTSEKTKFRNFAFLRKLFAQAWIILVSIKIHISYRHRFTE